MWAKLQHLKIQFYAGGMIYVVVFINHTLKTGRENIKPVRGDKQVGDRCTKAFEFVNCEENHTSYNKKCNVYKRGYDIQKEKG